MVKKSLVEAYKNGIITAYRIERPLNLKIIGSGSYVPPKIVTNFDLEKILDTSDEWITQRTGIKQRHIVSDGIDNLYMLTEASKKAFIDAGYAKLENKEFKPTKIPELIIDCTNSPDERFPITAARLQHNLNLKGSNCFAVRSGCNVYIDGMLTALAYINTYDIENALVIAYESLSKDLDWTDRETCILLGDAASISIVEKTKLSLVDRIKNPFVKFFGKNKIGLKTGILSCSTIVRGDLADLITLPARPKEVIGLTERTIEREYIKIQGRKVYTFAVKDMIDLLKAAVEVLGLKLDDLDYIVPHNANLRIIEEVCKGLGLSKDEIGKRVLVNIQNYANTSAASIPLAIDERKEEVLKKGNLLGIMAWGASGKGSAIVYKHPG